MPTHIYCLKLTWIIHTAAPGCNQII